MTKLKDKISRQSSGDLKEPICIVEFNFLAVLSLYGLGFTDFFLYGLKNESMRGVGVRWHVL